MKNIFAEISQELQFSLAEIGKFLFFLNIFKSRRRITFKRLLSNYLYPSAFIVVVFSEISRTAEDLYKKILKISPETRL